MFEGFRPSLWPSNSHFKRLFSSEVSFDTAAELTLTLKF